MSRSEVIQYGLSDINGHTLKLIDLIQQEKSKIANEKNREIMNNLKQGL